MNNHNLRHKLELKLFNGYVIEPIPIAFFACLVGLAFLVIAMWATYDTNHPASADVYVENCTVVDFYEDGSSYVLVSSYGQLFDLPCNSMNDDSLLINMIESQEDVIITSKNYSGDSNRLHTIISITNKDGKAIVSATAVTHAREKLARIALIVLWSTCIGYWGFIIIVYYIICNAHKFPRLASIFVRAPYRNF